MLFRSLFLCIVSLYLSANVAQAAPPLKSVCRGSGLSVVDGMCRCEALNDFVNPWQRGAAEYCAALTDSRDVCLNPNYPYPMRFIDRRCYCPTTRKFIGDPVRDPDQKSSSENLRKLTQIVFKNHRQYTFEINFCQTRPMGYRPGELIPGARSIQIETLVYGARGGWLYQVSNLPGKPWLDQSDDNTFQGDPHFNQEVLGPKTSRFFGFFSSENNEKVFVPSIENLNNGIDQINLFIQIFFPDDVYNALKIPVRFYLAKGLEGVEDYLKKFAYEGGIPIAVIDQSLDETLLFHDINYHAGTWLVIPNPITHLVQKQIKAIFDLREYVKKHHPDKVESPQIKYYFHSFFREKASQIDTGSGNLTLLARSQTPDFNQKVIDGSAYPLVGLADSTDNVISISKFISDTGNSLLSVIPEKANQNLMRDLIREFILEQQQKDAEYSIQYFFMDPRYPTERAGIQIDYLNSVKQRIQQLENLLP